MRLADKVVLVTGAGSGMGRVALRMFAQQGARIIAADIDGQALQSAVREVADADASITDAILPVVGNVALAEDVERIVERGVSHFGTLNVIYNNAGIMPGEDTVRNTDIGNSGTHTWVTHSVRWEQGRAGSPP